jgi:tetratricopeptide (TPR) repeat protein
VKKVAIALTVVLIIAAAALLLNQVKVIRFGPDEVRLAGYVGSSSCRGCHERFYELWAPSHHGMAMQPVTSEFVETKITPHDDWIQVGGFRYRVELRGGKAWIAEEGESGKKKYRFQHAMGGKNVYYFLTELDRGHLQVLPLGYDVRREEWFNAPSSMVRHSVGEPGEPVHWTDRLLTFNTSCYNCHVSQLVTNYDLADDSYETVWAEPGINCETCHGGAGEHIRVCEEAGEGNVPENLEIIRVKNFSPDELNSLCATCHAKGFVLTGEFMPGERFFDHFGLVTFEDRDFHADARDLGENFTYNLWLTSPCLASSEMDCLHCHTASGRFRQKDNPNEACLPCHQQYVDDPESHTHHPSGSSGNECIGCHMPTTEFARMRRSDHSMRPPTPAATLEFGSPNACNVCHTDRDAAWADSWVRKWRKRDYQKPILERARLIRDARQGNWDRLPAMLDYIRREDRDAVYATSLIRMMEGRTDQNSHPVLLEVLGDPSPLVRSAAAEILAPYQTPEVRDALLQAAADDYRVVRINAAEALSSFPPEAFQGIDLGNLPQAIAEFEGYLSARPDDWLSHYNRGNHYLTIGKPDLAIDAYQTALRLDPSYVPPLVNAAIAYNRIGKNEEAEASLQRALEMEPGSIAAQMNLALLLGELGRKQDAMAAFERVYALDSTSAVAAYNLSVLRSESDPAEAVRWAQLASELGPEQPRYAFTYAFYLNQTGQGEEAQRVLEKMITDFPAYGDAYLLLGDVHIAGGNPERARAVYRRALKVEAMPVAGQRMIAGKLQALEEQ